MPMDNASLKGKYGEFLSSRIIWQTQKREVGLKALKYNIRQLIRSESGRR